MAPAAGFAGFTEHRVKVQSDALAASLKIYALKGGTGPGLLLLHGYPQTSHIWHKLAGKLAEKYTVVVPDLRGYGQSDKPAGSETHVEYSKREMANDQVQVMKHFDLPSFFLVGHDRGARVAHRLSLDHPEAVKRVMVLDIAPTLWMYEHTDMVFATAYWHWFFLIQNSPGPEKMIGADPDAFWSTMSDRDGHNKALWSEEDLKAYKAGFYTPESIHATCEDYRAAASIDLEHDRADRSSGRKLAVPALRVLWAGRGMIERMGGGTEVWKEHCADGVELSGRSLDGCGHYIPEERAEELLGEIERFLP